MQMPTRIISVVTKVNNKSINTETNVDNSAIDSELTSGEAIKIGLT